MEISSPTNFEIELMISRCPYDENERDCDNCFWDCSDEDDDMII